MRLFLKLFSTSPLLLRIDYGEEKFRTSSKMSRWRSLALTVLDMAKLSPSSSGKLAGLAGTATTLKGVQRSGSNTSEESSSEVVVVLWLPTIVSGSTPNFRSAPSSLSYSSRSFLQNSMNLMIFVKQVVLGPLVYLGWVNILGWDLTVQTQRIMYT